MIQKWMTMWNRMTAVENFVTMMDAKKRDIKMDDGCGGGG